MNVRTRCLLSLTSQIPRRMRCYGNGVPEEFPEELEEMVEPSPAIPRDGIFVPDVRPPWIDPALGAQFCGRHAVPVPNRWTTSDGRRVLFYGLYLNLTTRKRHRLI